MSNTKRARWTEAQVTVANAELLIGELCTQAEASAARTVLTDRLLNELAVLGHDPGLIARGGQALSELGDEFWHGIYTTLTAE
jgi:hypothetical protein